MKAKLLLFFSVILFISSCKREGPCIPTPCARPDLNQLLSIELDFCNIAQGDDCFSDEELAQIAVVSKYENDYVIAVDSFFNLANFNNTISLGKEGLPLTTNDDDFSALDLNFDLLVINTGHHFTISDIEIAAVPSDIPCGCDTYEIVQLKLNEETIEVKSYAARLTLKK